MTVREGRAPFRTYQTWYRITGDLASGKTPVIIAHGGPGCTHDYVDSFKALAADGRAVIHYDQIGNGRSTHLPDKGADFWTVELFLEELENLIRHLGIEGGYDLLGQSWGGMLGAEFAVQQPAGLRALVIADSPASMELWVQEANRLRAALPPDVQETLTRHERAGTTDSAEYRAATEVFYARHVCRIVPNPPEVQRTNQAVRDDPTVYGTMNGPNEFHVVGTLKHWSVIDRLPRIEVPTLLISGAHDEATEATMQPFADLIPDVRWHIFPNSSHMPHVEEFADCMKIVGDFLADCDTRQMR
ncbi:proline iminopeptidase-family hydrolase [Paenirhodobacter populi]|uniref:proline iminopeptidase-family hydrolase n=1 Tax=Paenirhodobacter populi TaxID=2306993 RepID=UPI000FE4104B|nr:proline iminopeptidase-family hydrolase [Sinirhodobacter populi]RWR07350.1 alpha/beta fold hydrolase [Sinirhodobacter populi]